MLFGGVIVRLGSGLPPNPDVLTLVEAARRAEAAQFSTVGLLDRLAHDNPEPLVVLSGIATVTSRIRIQTEVLLAPLRDTALLAKQAATLDILSGGRFTLGLGVGGRADDYAAADRVYRQRGKRMDEQLGLLKRIWAGESPAEGAGPVGPAPLTAGGPEILFGAFAPAALERVARWGDGILAAGSAAFTAHLYGVIREQWQAAGRSGQPRLVAQIDVGLGDGTVEDTRTRLARYYGPNDAYTPIKLNDLQTEVGQLRDTIKKFEDLGTDELMLYTWSHDPHLGERLADAVK
jgi:alkanesulfonate monooxygenase SsuD/methylene tetrahydromethanopterin reductase-like flavin-dependent oxidoreductase (luciferase family)